MSLYGNEHSYQDHAQQILFRSLDDFDDLDNINIREEIDNLFENEQITPNEYEFLIDNQDDLLFDYQTEGKGGY